MQTPFLTAKMLALAPRVITRREIIRGVPKRWRGSYPDDSYSVRNGPAGAIRLALEVIDLETAMPADVSAIIGNDSWTENKCDVCEADRDTVVSVPREYDTPIRICQICAEGVTQMLAQVPA